MGTCPGSNGVFRFEIALPVSEELCLQASHLLCPEERKKERRKKERKKKERITSHHPFSRKWWPKLLMTFEGHIDND